MMGTTYKTIFSFFTMNVEDYTCRISLFLGYPWQPVHRKCLVGFGFSTIMWWCVAYIGEKKIARFWVSRYQKVDLAKKVDVRHPAFFFV